jgi:hypothetical protein
MEMAGRSETCEENKTLEMSPSPASTMQSTTRKEDSSLTTQCLDFCQALASQGKDFNFSLKIGSNFSFSLDTRETTPSAKVEVRKKKKPSPSSLRRNAERREAFLVKKKPAAGVPVPTPRPEKAGAPGPSQAHAAAAVVEVTVEVHQGIEGTEGKQEVPENKSEFKAVQPKEVKVENTLVEKLNQAIKEVLVKRLRWPGTVSPDGAVGRMTEMLLEMDKEAPGVQYLLNDKKQLTAQVKKMLRMMHEEQCQGCQGCQGHRS